MNFKQTLRVLKQKILTAPMFMIFFNFRWQFSVKTKGTMMDPNLDPTTNSDPELPN